MGPKPGAEKQQGRKLVATGDPDFPYLYEATPQEMEALQAFGA